MAAEQPEALREALARRGRGSGAAVALAGEPGYDQGRRPWQLAVEHRPVAVVAPRDTAEVAATVRAAAEVGLPVSVMSTGHGSVAPADGHVLLNVSGLRGVQVDRAAAEVEVAAGTTWSEVLDATAGSGLAPLSGTVGSTGVVGYTVQGGLGWFSRRDGFAAASVVSAEMITHSGELVTASRSVNPDLWWALRGGGGGVGVVTRLRFALHPVPAVFGGSAYFAIEHAEPTLRAFREFSREQPPWSNAALLLLAMRDLPQLPAALRGRRVLVVRAFAVAEEPAARRALEPLLAAAGPPLLEDYRQTSFAEMLTRQGPPLPPSASFERADLFDRLDDAVLDAILEHAGPGADDLVTCIELRQWGAALHHASGAEAVAHPSTEFSVITAARLGRPDGDAEVTAAVAGFLAAIEPHANGESLLNLLPEPDRTATAFTAETFARLRSVKRDWDPHDLFHAGHRIPPTEESP